MDPSRVVTPSGKGAAGCYESVLQTDGNIKNIHVGFAESYRRYEFYARFAA